MVTANGREDPLLVGTLMSEVVPERVEWLWPGRFPFGKIAVLVLKDVTAAQPLNEPTPRRGVSRPDPLQPAGSREGRVRVTGVGSEPCPSVMMSLPLS